MPKKMNTNKAAAAVYQNAKAIEDAMRTGGLFGAVTRSLGNRGFEVTLRSVQKGASSHAAVVQATPRALFQGGKKAPIRIAVGHVVLLAGELKAKGDGVQRPLEIVGRLDSKDQIREMVKLGFMTADVLGIAETAGAVETAARAEVAQEDLFDSDGSDEDFWTAGMREAKGGLKQQRQAAETVATITARVATLKGNKAGKGVDGSVELGDLADPLLFSDPDYARFKRWRAHKATAVAMAGGGSTAAAPINADSALTVAELMRQFRLEKEAAERAADQAAIVAREEAAAKGAEAKAWLAKQGAKENWDDEEVDLADL
jgi:hypothetical protein